jgi:ribosomal-protein-alanine N-acetyltransferase
MTAADVDAVLGIEQAVQGYPWSRGNFTDALDSGYLCCVDDVALIAGHREEGVEIRGYAILMPMVDEAELLAIGVAGGRQRQGLGRMILGNMLEAARNRNMRCVYLEVRVSNEAAIALYRSAGFLKVGERQGYYQNVDGCENALTMACNLTGDLNG